MKIETNGRRGVMVVRLDAESLETGNVGSFRLAIGPVLERHDHVVLDLSSIGFMDSTGLGALLSTLRTLKAKNGGLKLSGLGPEVAQLFEMVMMDRVFDIYPDTVTASAAFRI